MPRPPIRAKLHVLPSLAYRLRVQRGLCVGARSVECSVRVALDGEIGGGVIRVAGNDVLLRLGKLVDEGLWELEVVLDDLWGSESEPLADADVLVFGRLQDLHENERLGASVFDVVTVFDGDVALVCLSASERRMS